MKAAVLHEVNKPLVIEDVSLPKPGPREVLIRTGRGAVPLRPAFHGRACIRIRCRPCSAMSPQAWSNRSAPTSPMSSPAITS